MFLRICPFNCSWWSLDCYWRVSNIFSHIFKNNCIFLSCNYVCFICCFPSYQHLLFPVGSYNGNFNFTHTCFSLFVVLKVTKQILFPNVSHPVSSSEMMFEILFDQVSAMASSFFYGDSKNIVRSAYHQKEPQTISVWQACGTPVAISAFCLLWQPYSSSNQMLLLV